MTEMYGKETELTTFATSNNQFYEFYTWDDLTSKEQADMIEYANYTEESYNGVPDDLACGQFIKTGNSVYYIGDFLSTNSGFVSLPDYYNKGIHGVLHSDYNLGIELYNDESYRIWHIRQSRTL